MEGKRQWEGRQGETGKERGKGVENVDMGARFCPDDWVALMEKAVPWEREGRRSFRGDELEARMRASFVWEKDKIIKGIARRLWNQILST